MLHACEVANEAEREVAMRRASGFMELFEAALNKECQPKADKLKAKGKNLKERPPGNGSIAGLKSQIKELIEMCTSDPSRKWTWGVDLTEADLAALIRGADRHSPHHPHSGYDTDLASMSLNSVTTYSIDPLKITDYEGHFDDLSPNFPFIPELADDQPPPLFRFNMIHASGKPIQSGSDSVLQAFAARAAAVRADKKLILQQEVDEPVSDFEADLDDQFPDSSRDLMQQSCRHWLGQLTSQVVPPTSPPIVLRSPSVDFREAMHCEIPDDIYVLPPEDDSHHQDMMAEAARMEIWREDKEYAKSDHEIVTSVFLLPSEDSDIDRIVETEVSAPMLPETNECRSDKAVSAAIVCCDPITGQFTKESFSGLVDIFMD